MKQTESIEGRVERLATFLADVSGRSTPDFSPWISGHNDDTDLLQCVIRALDQWEATPDEKRWWAGKILTALRADGVADHPWTVDYLKALQQDPVLRPPAPFIDITALSARSKSDDPAKVETARNVLRKPYRSLVLLGDPGSGKTSTLLSFVQDAISSALVDASAPIPVFIDLAGIHTASALDTKPHGIKDDLRTMLDRCRRRNRSVVLLFDGLDKLLTSTRRSQLVAQILGLGAEEGVRSVILTCTTSQWSPSYLDRIATNVYVIQPLDVARGGNAERYARQRVARHVQRLMRIAKRPTSRLSQIVRHPLYLSLLCDFLEDKEPDAPFPEITGQLIHEWVERRLGDSDDGVWFREGGDDYLASVACLMVKRNAQTVRADDVKLTKAVLRPGWQQALDKACSCRILSSSAHPGRADAIAFSNPYFRDHFAALWLRSRFADGDYEEILRLLQDTAWDRPFLFAVQNGVDAATLSRVMDKLIGTDLTLFREVLECKSLPSDVDVTQWLPTLQSLAKVHALRYEACRCLCILDPDLAVGTILQSFLAPDDWQLVMWDVLENLPARYRVAVLDECIRSMDKSIREIAVATLIEHMPEHRPELLAESLAATRSSCFRAAVRGLRRLASPDATELLIRTLLRLLGSPPPELTDDPVAEILKEYGAKTPATFYTPAQRLALDAHMADAKHVTQALMDIPSALAKDSLLELLSDPQHKSTVALLIARCDEHLLFHARLSAVEEGFLKGSSSKSEEFAAFIKNDMAMLATRHDETLGLNRRVSPSIARRVTEILKSAPPDDLWQKASPDDDSQESKKELWYFVQRSRYCGPEVVSEDWEYLWSLTSDAKCDDMLSYEIVHALARIDPRRMLRSLASMLERHDAETVASCMSDAAELVNEIPGEFADEFCRLFEAIEKAPSSVFLRKPFAKLPKTDRQAQNLIRMFKICPFEKTRHLLDADVLWPHHAILSHLRRWMDVEKDMEARESIAELLALLGEARGLTELTTKLPAWVSQAVSWERVAGRCDVRTYEDMIWHLRRFPAESTGDDNRLLEILGNALGVLEEKTRDRLVTAAQAALPAEGRAELFEQARDRAGRRYFELVSPA